MLELRVLALSLASLLAIAVAGCHSSVGPNGDVVGGPCAASGGCAGGSRCLIEPDFPGGACTIDCVGAGGCPGGSACVEENGGTCLDLCASDGDCRAGYRCISKRNLAAPGESLVCMGA